MKFLNFFVMKKMMIVLVYLFFFFNLNLGHSQTNGLGVVFITDSGPIQLINNGTKIPCTVEGKCKSETCDAYIECGCDETPKCSCGWISCSCDCEKKGRRVTNLSPDYVDNINSFMGLVSNSNNSAIVIIKNGVTDLINSINIKSYETFQLNAKQVYNDIHNISDSQAKSIINNWFETRNIDDRI